MKPGAFVTVTLPDQSFEQVARLPEAALYDGDHVFVVIDDRLRRRQVELAAWDGGDVLVRGDLEGAEVLASRLAEAGDGVLIRRTGRSAGLSDDVIGGAAAHGSQQAGREPEELRAAARSAPSATTDDAEATR